MNNATRKKIRGLSREVESHGEVLDIIRGQIEELQTEEEEKFDNLPEGLQDSEVGAKLQESSDALQQAIEALESFELSEILDSLESATE